VSESLVEDQLAKIPIGNNEDTALFSGDCQNIFIGKTMRIVPGCAITG